MKHHDQSMLKRAILDEETASYKLLHDELTALQDGLVKSENGFSDSLKKVNPQHLTGAINLIHYLGLRRKDVRPLQIKLAAAGLSSLGRAESHVLQKPSW